MSTGALVRYIPLETAGYIEAYASIWLLILPCSYIPLETAGYIEANSNRWFRWPSKGYIPLETTGCICFAAWARSCIRVPVCNDQVEWSISIMSTTRISPGNQWIVGVLALRGGWILVCRRRQ